MTGGYNVSREAPAAGHWPPEGPALELERVEAAGAAAGVAAAAASCFDAPLNAELRLRLTDVVLVKRCTAPLPAPDGLASEPRLEVGGGVGVGALVLAALPLSSSSSSSLMLLHRGSLRTMSRRVPAVLLPAPRVVAVAAVVEDCFACFFDRLATLDRLGEASCCCNASRPRLCDPPLPGARADVAAVLLDEAAAGAAVLVFFREVGLVGATAAADAVVALVPTDAA